MPGAWLGGGSVALLEYRDYLAGEEGGLVAGEGLDEEAAGPRLVDELLQGVDDLIGSAGDGDDRPALAVGDALDVELGVGLGDDPPAAGDVQPQEGAEGLGHVVQVALRLLDGLTDGHEALDHQVRARAGVPVLGGRLDVVL